MSKMGYVLRDRSDGSVELVETRPTVIATFANRAIADQMFAAFVKVKPLARTAAVVPPEAVAAQISNPVLPSTLPIEPVAPPVPLDANWMDAFRALVLGSNMNEVAQTLGVPMPQLRGKYADWCKAQKTAPTITLPAPSAPHTSVNVEVDIEKEECRICGKEFAASLSADGLCARCSR